MAPTAKHANSTASLGATSFVVPFDEALPSARDTIHVDMEIKMPKKEKKQKPVERHDVHSIPTDSIFEVQKFPEPVYFENVDCVGLPNFFDRRECHSIIELAESQRFSVQQRPQVMNMNWTDIIDSKFADAIWSLCGLGWFLRTISVDGMVPCGLNDVVRIQKFTQGCLLGRHTDQYVKRADGKVSKYSLRVFLNGKEERWFEGGLSAFHTAFRPDPVVFEPETGLALLYPQGEHCAVQEETEVYAGVKYVLRADVLFCKPEAAEGR